MLIFKNLVLSVVIFLHAFCSENKEQSAILCNEWVRVSSKENIEIFHPKTVTHAPSRGKEKVSFRDDHTLSFRRIAANDRHISLKGKWKLRKNTLILKLPDGKEKYKILSITQEELKLKRL